MPVKRYQGSRSLKYPPSEEGFPWVGYVELDGFVVLVHAPSEKKLESAIRVALKKLRQEYRVLVGRRRLEEIFVRKVDKPSDPN